MARMQPPKYPRFAATLRAAPTTVASDPIRPSAGPSVSDATRLAREALANAEVQGILMGEGGRVPITGNYYDAIRAQYQVRTQAPSALTNQFVRGVFNTRGGVKSFAAANYKYPSQQMVIGAALAGVRPGAALDPRVAMVIAARRARRDASAPAQSSPAPAPAQSQPQSSPPSSSSSASSASSGQSMYCAGGRACRCPDGSCNAACCPQAETLSGYTPRLSPSEDRKRQMARLMGLGATANTEIWKVSGKNVDESWGINIRTFLDELPSFLPEIARDPVMSAIGTIRSVIESPISPTTYAYEVLARNIGATDIPGPVDLPSEIREAFLKWAYKKMWGVDIRPDLLQKAMALPVVSAQNLTAEMSKAEYDPTVAPPSGSAPSTQAPPSGGGGGGRSSLFRPNIPFQFNRPVNLRPAIPMLSLRKDIADAIANQAGGASTGTGTGADTGTVTDTRTSGEEKKPFPTAAVVGGLAVVGLVGYMVMRKR